MPLDDEARKRAAETKRERTRQKIEKAIYRVLSDVPVREVTMRAIAREAGVSEATLYRYYPSVSAVFESSETFVARWEDQLDPRATVLAVAADVRANVLNFQLREWAERLMAASEADMDPQEVANLLVAEIFDLNLNSLPLSSRRDRGADA